MPSNLEEIFRLIDLGEYDQALFSLGVDPELYSKYETSGGDSGYTQFLEDLIKCSRQVEPSEWGLGK
jgi:hypothetical protein